MSYQRPVRELNMNGSSFNPAALERAVVLAGLTWGMPPAQVCAANLWALNTPTVIFEHFAEDELARILRLHQTQTFCMGIPVEVDKELPQGTVQLRYQGAVIFEIQNCSVPYGFPIDVPSGK